METNIEPESHAATDVAWRIGAPQGSGIDTVAGLFGRACAFRGLNVYSRREYHSNIMGRHSYCDVRVGSVTFHTHRECPDILVSTEPEALVRHALTVTSGGQLLYADTDEDIALDRLPQLDRNVRDRLVCRLEAAGLTPSTAGVLALARQNMIATYDVPYHRLLKELGRSASMQAAPARIRNILGLAVSAALMNLPETWLTQAIDVMFATRPEVKALNKAALMLGYQYVEERVVDRPQPVSLVLTQRTDEVAPRLFINGCQSVAIGKLAAGLDMQSYYPISPATDESAWLERHLERPEWRESEVCQVVQTEDEQAAAALACGAALAGARAASSTSGPGFSLMAETLGWAGMNEVPLVITLYQRAGPSTGMPTRTEQGDLQCAVYGGHGEFPRIVLASADVIECFEDAGMAFNYAERYQLPVIHLLDKALSSTTQTVPRLHTPIDPLDRGASRVPSMANSHIERYRLTPSGISPRPVIGQTGMSFCSTGVEHSTDGRVSEDPTNREQMMEKRANKLGTTAKEIPFSQKIRVYGDREASLTVATWGSVTGAVREAAERLAGNGIGVRVVQVHLIWPFPAKELEQILAESSPLVVVENNYSGQFASLLRAQTGRACEYLIVKYNGRPISGEALSAALRDIHAGQGVARTVLRSPFE